MKWLEKDVGLALDLGSEIGVPLLLTGLTQQLFQTAMAKGYGEEDICGSIRVLEETAGVEVTAAKAGVAQLTTSKVFKRELLLGHPSA